MDRLKKIFRAVSLSMKNKLKPSRKQTDLQQSRRQWIDETKRPNRISQKKQRQRARWTSK